MIKKLFNKINNLRFPNETGDKVSNIIDFIAKNKLSFFQVQNDYNQENRETFKYNRVLKKINIPNDFSQEPGNKEIYEEAKIQYGNSALETIVSHEIGHQIHHQFLRKQENLNNWDIGKYGDICLTHTGIADNPNHKLNEANDFFKVDNRNPNGIERFMQQNFMESYADCYSGLVTYLKNDSKAIFDQISAFRKKGKKEIEGSKELSINNEHHILKGKFATTEYFNYYGIEKFKDNFINNLSKNVILKLPIEAIHHSIQVESLDGLYKTMKEEAKNNDLFLLELKYFCQTRYKCSVNDFFDKFESHLTNLRQFYCKGNLTNTLDNNAPPFDYDMRCSQLSKNSILQQYRATLSKEDLTKFDNAGISELRLNCFDDHYTKQQSKYNLSNVDLESKPQISQNILSLREKFLEQKKQNNSLHFS